jgi:predicted transcriptional regulator
VIPQAQGDKMSKALSLKLKDEVFQEAEEIRRRSKCPRNAYFNQAINFYNKLWKRKLLKKTLAEESALVAQDSLKMLQAFEQFEEELG